MKFCNWIEKLCMAGAFAVAVAILAAPTMPAQAQEATRGPQYTQVKRVSKAYGKAVAIRLAGKDAALAAKGSYGKTKAKVVLRPGSNLASSRFELFSAHGGSYRIMVPATKACLSCTSRKGEVKSGAAVRTAAYRGKAWQLWKLKTVDKKRHLLAFVSVANKKLRLTAKTPSRKTGSDLVMSARKSLSCSSFGLYVPQAQIPDGSYGLTDDANTHLALHVIGDEYDPGARFALAARKKNNSFNFLFSYHPSSGYYTLKNRRSKLFFDAGGTHKNGRLVSQREQKNRPRQWWYLLHRNTGGYYLGSADSGQAVALEQAAGSGAGDREGARAAMRAYAPDGSALWSIRPSNRSNDSYNCAYKLHIVDAEGTDEAYHPKVVAFARAWHGYKYWMAYTPYPHGNATYEDPYLVASNDLVNWETPPGATNPMDDTRKDGVYADHNSDTHLLYNAKEGRLELYWRWIDSAQAIIYRMVSKDGSNWSKREVVCRTVDRINGNEFISPAIVCENGHYKMWYVGSQAGNVLYRTSADGVSWSAPKKIRFPFAFSEMKVWHLDVEKTDKGYEALLASYDEWDNRNRMSLWYSTSKKGTTGWSEPVKVISPTTGSERWDNMGIYRSCLLKVNGRYVVIYGGTSREYHHGLGIMYGSDIHKLKGVDVDFSDAAASEKFAAKLAAFLER